MILDIQMYASAEWLGSVSLQVYEQRRLESIIPGTSGSQLKLGVWLEKFADLMRQFLLAKEMMLV